MLPGIYGMILPNLMPVVHAVEKPTKMDMLVFKREPRTFFFVGLFILLAVSKSISLVVAKDTYYLGFLSPSPTPNGDSLIPEQLAQQWQSAFQVALEVLNAENRTYQLEAVLADTGCSWMKVLGLSHVLTQRDLIGIVGPACSGAALSATQYFDQMTPIVSFAATHQALSNRDNYPNFFRTVYGDKYQTQAILSVMEKLELWNATIVCSKDYYSLSLASSIQQAAIQRVSSMKVLDAGVNSSISAGQVEEVLNGLNPTDVVILAVPPLVAKDFLTFAAQVGKLRYPWWYLGSDGVTAFDPSADGSSVELMQVLEGDIGIAPQGGDLFTDTECRKYLDYWKEKAYPGLPSGGLNETRAYVTNLIDTVALYFHVVDALVEANATVNASAVLLALQGSPSFQGCSGNLQIDPETGSRRVSSSQPAVYNLVSFENNSWTVKGEVYNTTFVSLQPISRPTPNMGMYDDGPTKQNGGLVAGVVLFSVGLLILITILIIFKVKKRSQARAFFRMTS